MSYFYVIEHIASSKLYAGSRTAKNCCPSELLQEFGYKTSSKIVKKIIEVEGLSAFKIRFVKAFENKDAIEWETRFLKKVDAANNNKFLNLVNNEVFDSDSLKIVMMNLYGYDNPQKVPEIKQRTKDTCIDKYGVDNPLKLEIFRGKETIKRKYGVDFISQSNEIKQKKIDTCNKNYCTNYPLQSKEIQEKYRLTCNERYGVDNGFQSEIVKEEWRNNYLEKYGVDNPFKNEDVKAKLRQTNFERYGDTSAVRSKVIQDKKKNTSKERYGGNSPMCSKEVQEKSKQSCINKYGVSHPSKIKQECSHCGKVTSMNHLNRHIKKYHEDIV